MRGTDGHRQDPLLWLQCPLASWPCPGVRALPLCTKPHASETCGDHIKPCKDLLLGAMMTLKPNTVLSALSTDFSWKRWSWSVCLCPLKLALRNSFQPFHVSRWRVSPVKQSDIRSVQYVSVIQINVTLTIGHIAVRKDFIIDFCGEHFICMWSNVIKTIQYPDNIVISENDVCYVCISHQSVWCFCKCFFTRFQVIVTEQVTVIQRTAADSEQSKGTDRDTELQGHERHQCGHTAGAQNNHCFREGKCFFSYCTKHMKNGLLHFLWTQNNRQPRFSDQEHICHPVVTLYNYSFQNITWNWEKYEKCFCSFIGKKLDKKFENKLKS